MRLLFIAFLASSACADPCRQVAEQVCACRANSSLERSCLAEVDAAREAHPASEESSLACEAVIEAKSCTCDALALGETTACGLAQSP
ncbi:MAG: hypothetical protein OSB21_02970 [Myxococcota bacterium]|nr:hypothetical protein [Myxococcota bacterium]